PWFGVEEAGAAVVREVAAIFEQPPLVVDQGGSGRKRPLDAVVPVALGVVLDPAEITGPSAAQLLERLEDRFGVGPAPEQIRAPPGLGDELEDEEIRQRLPRRAAHALDEPDAALGVDEGPLL